MNMNETTNKYEAVLWCRRQRGNLSQHHPSGVMRQGENDE